MQCPKCGLAIDDMMFEKMKSAANGDIYCFVCQTLLFSNSSPDTANRVKNKSININKLPHPIATSFEHLEEDIGKNASALEKLFSLRDIIEVTIKYLTIFEVAYAIDENTLTMQERKELLTKLARPSLGTWLGILKYLLKKHFALREDKFTEYQSLFYIKNSGGNLKETSLMNEWGDFVTFRNSVIGHGARIKQSEYEKYFKEWFEELHSWQALFEVLERLFLVYGDGENWTKLQGPQLPRQGEKMGQTHIAFEGTRYYINPFIFIHLCESCESIQLFFYDSNKNYGSSKTNPRVNALEYDAGHKPSLRQPISDLEKVFGEEMLKDAFKHVQFKIAEIEGKIITWAELIREHADIYGRRFLIEHLNRYISENRSGIFLLTADPGVGKTSFSSYLINHGISKTYFFYRRSAGIQSPNDFVKSVYHSLLLNYELVDANPTEDPNEMRNKLENLLEDISNHYLRTDENCILVVDGLDEGAITADGKDAFDLLPKKLPKGVFLFVTSRNTIALNRILFEKQIYHYHLKSSSTENIDDVANYLEQGLANEKLGPINFVEMAKKFEGNFLLAKLVIDGIRAGEMDGSEVDLLKITRLEDYYNYYWETLYSSSESEYFHLIYQILGLLAISKAPLNESQVNGILDLKVGDFERGLRFCRQFLHVIEEGEEIYFRIFHDTFREYIWHKTQGSSIKLHQRVAEYFVEVEPDAPFSYGLRYKLFHLAHSNNLVDVVDWIKACISSEQKQLIIHSLEDLVEHPATVDLSLGRLNQEIKTWVKEFQLVEGESSKINVSPFLLYLLETKFGQKGTTIYFSYVLRSVPTPLATVTNKYELETQTFYKMYRLIDIGEQILKFNGLFYLALLKEEDPKNELVDMLHEHLVRPSFGTYIYIIRKALQALYNKNQSVYEEHMNTWFRYRNGKFLPKRELAEAEEIVKIRNHYAHGSIPSEEKLERDIEFTFEKVKTILYSLTVFSKYQLFEIIEQQEDRAFARFYQGDKTKRFKEEWIPFNKQDNDVGSLYFKLPDERYICFSPYMKTMEVEGEIQFLFWNHAKGKFKNQVTYINYDKGNTHRFEEA